MLEMIERGAQVETKCKPGDLLYCPVGHHDDPVSHTHCNCWFDGLECCHCGISAEGKEPNQGVTSGVRKATEAR
jgi:hypothetical protein